MSPLLAVGRSDVEWLAVQTKWWIALLGGGLVLATLGWLASHRLSLGRSPTLLWKESDLPPLPAPADNGYELFRARPRRLDDRELASDFERARQDNDWTAAQGLEARIAKEAAGESFQATSAVLDAAGVRPRFADACPTEITAECAVMHLIEYGRVAELAVARLALHGEWERALGRLESHLRSRLDLARSSRRLVTALVASSQVDAALELARLVLDGAAREKAVLRRARLESMAALLDGPADTGAARRAVIADYLAIVSAIRILEPTWRSPESRPAGESGYRRPKIALDPDHTLTLANAHYTAVMAVVDGGFARPIPELQLREGLLWWVYNPAGKMMLEVAVSVRGSLHGLTERRAKSLALREDARSRLRTAAEAALPPSTCDCIPGDLTWGRELLPGIFYRRSNIAGCREYTTIEWPILGGGKKEPAVCTQPLERCTGIGLGETGAVASLLGREDVWAAFEAPPRVYGADLSHADNPSMFVIHRGRKIRIGEPCDGSSLARQTKACVPIPEGLLALKKELDAMDMREGQRGQCAERRHVARTARK